MRILAVSGRSDLAKVVSNEASRGLMADIRAVMGYRCGTFTRSPHRL